MTPLAVFGMGWLSFACPELGQPMVDHFIGGYNTCLMAYGQRGSGKSYTMFGKRGQRTGAGDGETDGIIPRIARHLFQRLNEMSGRGGVPGDRGADEAAGSEGQASTPWSLRYGWLDSSPSVEKTKGEGDDRRRGNRKGGHGLLVVTMPWMESFLPSNECSRKYLMWG